ncbi:DMT family transporter [Marinobacter daepoensis]|uniref:DMT family transporter n=1 Tax=Marinobacter daepoensis TaxID=262077 RepID=UPI000686469C|nr:DMT family transporter [Marinobacter daepoensis]
MKSSFPLFASSLIFLAILAGAVVPFQAASNALLGRTFGHPLWGSMTSLLVSVIALIPVMALAKVPFPLVKSAFQLPFWAWLGGAAGVFFITSALIVAPRIGATAFIVAVIAGQLLVSLTIDHHGLFGMPEKPTTVAKGVGVVLIFAGMLLVQWSPSATEGKDKTMPPPMELRKNT